MKKRLVAIAVSLAVLLGTAVKPQAGASVGDDAGAEQMAQNMSSEGMQPSTAEDSAIRVVSISLDSGSTGAVTEDGSLYMWGSNFRGCLGAGPVGENCNRPVKILENIQTISIGGHCGAVTKDGNLYMWGRNDYGGLGDGTESHSNRPVKVMDSVQTVSNVWLRSGAVTEDGSLYMWGWNNSNVSPPQGILGDGTGESRDRPVKVMDNVQTVSLGFDCSGALTKDGSLYVWGFDRIEDGYHSEPVKVMDNVQTVSLGNSYMGDVYVGGALTKDGSLYMWGNNYSGQLGDGTNEDRNSPVKVMDNVQMFCLGNHYSGALTKDGSLYMWGRNSSGQLGDGTNENGNSPVKVMDNVQTFSLGFDFGGALTKDGSLYMWGGNSSGQLGNGTNEGCNNPVKVMDNVQTFSLGGDFGGAVVKDGSLYMWGNNSSGQLGDGTYENRNIPVRISLSSIQQSAPKTSQKITYHSTAIKKGRAAYGSVFSLNAATTGTGKLTYKSSNNSIFSIDASGTVTVKGYGPAYIKIKASGGNGYKSAVRRFKLTAVPRCGKITKAKWQKSGVYFKWKPEKMADGYEYALAYNKKFSGQSRKKTSKTGLHLTKYKTGTKKMFLKVRTYKKVGKKTYYGSWSRPCSVKLKKSGGGQSSYAIAN